MIFAFGFLLSFIFSILAGFHFFWGFGGKWGADGAIPSGANGEKLFSPSVLSCFVVGFGLLAIAIFMAYKGQLLDLTLPAWLSNYGLWALATAFGLRAIGEFRYVGFFKKVKNTKFAHLDTLYYSPLCLLLAMMMILLQNWAV